MKTSNDFRRHQRFFLPFIVAVLWVALPAKAYDNGKVLKLGDLKINNLSSRELEALKKELGYGVAGSGIWGWSPEGVVHGVYDPSCHPRVLEESLIKAGIDAQKKWIVLRKFFDRCDFSMSSGLPSFVFAYLKGSNIYYNYLKNGFTKTEIFETSKGIRFPYRLLMQPYSGSHPLMIVKCGNQCDLDSAVNSRVVMNFFEEGSFHVLLLPSTTGFAIPKMNRLVTVGGVDEGTHIFEIARFLKTRSPYRKRISSLHVMGNSIGGSAVLFANKYADAFSEKEQVQLLDSVQVGCSVVDLESTMRNLFSGNFVGDRMGASLAEQFSELANFVPILGQLIPDAAHLPAPGEISDFISASVQPFFKKYSVSSSWGYAPFENLKISNDREYWKAHRFQDVAEQKDSPVLMWTPLDDKVVRPELNAKVLAEEFSNRSKSPYKILYTKTGSHCEFYMQYPWALAGTIQRAWALSTDRDFLKKRKIQIFNLKLSSRWWDSKPSRNAKFRSALWKVKKGDSAIRLRVTYLDKVSNNGSDHRGPITKSQLKTFEYKVDPRTLGLRLNLPVVTQETAQGLTRYLNARLWPMASDGFYVRTGSSGPVKVEVITYGPNERL